MPAPLVTAADKVSRNILTNTKPGSLVTVSLNTVAGNANAFTMPASSTMPKFSKPFK